MLTQEDADRHLAEQTERLVATLAALTDLGTPSLCRGWTRAHVVAHLSRNADGILNMVRGAHGESRTMYRSVAARESDITDGARRPDQENLDDAITTGRRVVTALAEVTPDVAGVTVHRLPGEPFGVAGQLSYRRLREVTYHHVDLRAGFTFADLPAVLQLAFLEEEVTRLRQSEHSPGLVIRTVEGDDWSVRDGVHQVTGPRAGVLLWLARGILEGLQGTDGATPPQLPEDR